jgi:hypothetical protein
MKTLALGLLAIVTTALIAVQHQQLGQLRTENASLQQASAEADQLKADLVKSTGAEAEAEDEIARLHEENRDLLKLRNQVYQLRQATTQFEQVRAENQRLQEVAQNNRTREPKHVAFQPIVIEIQNLTFQGLNTPEAAVQTCLWAQREGNADALYNCYVPERQAEIRTRYGNMQWQRQNIPSGITIEIVARRDVDPNTVQIGVQVSSNNGSISEKKMLFSLKLRNGEWKLDADSLNF